MALSVAETAQIVQDHQRSKNDTGSPEVQIALLSGRIESLTRHMKVNPHDFHSRYGLSCLVSQRRRLMTYLKRTRYTDYRALLEKLGIRGQ